MGQIKHIFKGESLSMLFAFPAEYDMARIQSHGIWIGGTEFTGVIIGQGIELKLTSIQTDLMSGNQRVSLWIDDSQLGVRKPYVGDIAVGNTNALPDNESTSEVYDVIVNVDISVTSIEAGDLMFNYVKGDPLTYDDLTPEQKAELQQPATDAIASIQAVELAVETAEGLRVQAEQSRQSNTAAAIQNAENATDDANEKAGQANDAATLANTKAGLADAAATNANTKAILANDAATNANNVANTYAAELAAKELKANKQNSLAVDGTGTKFPTVDAVNAKIGAMSGELIADYTHTSNKEVHISSIDYATNTFTSVGHGLSNSVSDRKILMLAINRNELIYPYNVMPFANLEGYIQSQGFWVINATPDTFQLSFTNGGSAIVLLNKPETDLTKWHFEYNAAPTIAITGLLGKINRGCRAVIDGSFCRFGTAYIGCTAGGKTYYKGVSGAVQEASYSNWNSSEIPIPSFGGVVVHTDYYTPSGHRKLLDVAMYYYTPTLNRIAFLQKVQNNISPVAIPDADKTFFVLSAGAMITNGTNIKLYTI